MATSGIVIVVSQKASGAIAHSDAATARAGISAQIDLEVADPDTALALHSGDVPLLATPRLVALCEEAAVRVLEGRLAPGQTSVANRVQFDHLAPVAIGTTVTAEATLAKVEGRRYVFTVSASVRTDNCDSLIGAGRVTRVVVDRGAFLEKARVPR